MIQKKINFIYSKNKIDFKKYIKTVEYHDTISYHDILTKLIKNDSENERPSDSVVNIYLMKKIIKVINNPESLNIYYAVSECNKELLNGIKDFIDSITDIDCEIIYNYYVIEHKKMDIGYFQNSGIELLDFINDTGLVKYN